MTSFIKTSAFVAVIALTFTCGMAAGKAKPKSKTATASQNQSSSSTPQQSSGSNSGNIVVSVTPPSAQVTAGSKQQFTALVTGAGSSVVLWSVSGPGCLNLSCGYITGDGLYNAPATPPSPPTVTVVATSFADFKTTGSATITITPVAPPAVVVSPNATQLNLGAQQQFAAVVTGIANTPVSWSVIDNGCGLNCGSINSFGLYTAPSSQPASPTITITARLNVFPPVVGSAQVTLLPPVNGNGGLTISPSTVQLAARGLQGFSATMNGSPVSFANWSLSGPGCTPALCGTISSSGVYFAPATVSTPVTVTVNASSIFPPGKSGTATIVLQPPICVSVGPQNAVVNTNGQQQFTANVLNTTNTTVLWSVSCGSNSCGSINGNAVYTAPGTVPNPNLVNITATSLADLSQKGSATLTIVGAGAVKVSISPTSNLQLTAGASLPFTATVVGPANTAVTWSVSGTGCVGSLCGTITQGGVYTAPNVLTGPAAVTITATSQANPTAFASASVQLIPLVGITLGPSNPQMTSGTQQQFSATVTGTSNATVLWSVGGGCLNSCGTISSSGLYTSPAGLQSPVAVTITASAQADPSKTASTGITVVPPVIVSVSPGGTNVSINSQQQYTVVVSGTSNPAVTWSVSGPGCSGSTCGTITPLNATMALYQAPGSIPVPATVNVVATLAADMTKFGSASLTVVPSNNAKLNGHYAFLFTGFDGAVPYQAAGTFVADGNGNLTNGVEDINCGQGAQDVICGSAPIVGSAFTGTYNLNADGRGTFTINGAVSSSTFNLAIAPVSGNARFIENDNSGIRGSGILEPQVTSDFNSSAFQGAGYAAGLVGVDPAGARIGVIGSLVLPTGMTQGANLQVNDGGSVFSLPVSGPNLGGTFTMSSNGRGVAALTAPGLGGADILNFSMYVVSRNEILLFSIDPTSVNPLLSGQILQQQLPNFPYTYIQAGNAIFSSSGLNGQNADIYIGKMSFTPGIFGNTSGTAQIAFNQNNGGIVTSSKNVPGIYLIATNGEITISAPGHPTFYVYPFGLNSGFILGSSAEVLSGKIESQHITLLQDFAFGPDSLILPTTPVTIGTGLLNLPQISGNEDFSQNSGFTSGLAFSGTGPTSFSDGSGTISLTSPSQQSLAFWIVSFAKIVAVETDSSALSPSLWIFEQ